MKGSASSDLTRSTAQRSIGDSLPSTQVPSHPPSYEQSEQSALLAFAAASYVAGEREFAASGAASSPVATKAAAKASLSSTTTTLAHSEPSPPIVVSPREGQGSGVKVKWVSAGSMAPCLGKQLFNRGLQEALETRSEFSRSEIDAFGVNGLTSTRSSDDFIFVTRLGLYFKPSPSSFPGRSPAQDPVTSSSFHNGAGLPDSPASEQGTPEQGTPEQGVAVLQGTADEQGTPEQGVAVLQGTADEQGTPEQGVAVLQGTADEQGTPVTGAGVMRPYSPRVEAEVVRSGSFGQAARAAAERRRQSRVCCEGVSEGGKCSPRLSPQGTAPHESSPDSPPSLDSLPAAASWCSSASSSCSPCVHASPPALMGSLVSPLSPPHERSPTSRGSTSESPRHAEISAEVSQEAGSAASSSSTPELLIAKLPPDLHRPTPSLSPRLPSSSESPSPSQSPSRSPFQPPHKPTPYQSPSHTPSATPSAIHSLQTPSRAAAAGSTSCGTAPGRTDAPGPRAGEEKVEEASTRLEDEELAMLAAGHEPQPLPYAFLQLTVRVYPQTP